MLYTMPIQLSDSFKLYSTNSTNRTRGETTKGRIQHEDGPAAGQNSIEKRTTLSFETLHRDTAGGAAAEPER